MGHGATALQLGRVEPEEAGGSRHDVPDAGPGVHRPRVGVVEVGVDDAYPQGGALQLLVRVGIRDHVPQGDVLRERLLVLQKHL